PSPRVGTASRNARNPSSAGREDGPRWASPTTTNCSQRTGEDWRGSDSLASRGPGLTFVSPLGHLGRTAGAMARQSCRVPSRRPPTPLSVQPTGRESVTTLRVNYSETDQMGVVYHGRHPVWLDIARTEFLRDAGFNYRDLEAQGFRLVVTDLQIRYRQP